ncbi:MAG: hypothetical protein LLG42_02680 [Chloroflexi bacterium]|nr:hypothetical protein [Chloroflexota bacterium]
MSETTPLSPFENEILAVMGAPSGVPDASTAFILSLKDRLHQQALQDLGAKPVRRRPFILQRGWAAAVIILLVLAVTVLAIGPQRVLAAVRGLFGYIPEVGIMQEGSSLRVLAEPATVERDGITLQVTEGAGDDLHTIVIYQTDGLSVATANSQGEGAMTGGLAMLVLPDGSILTQTGGKGKSWGTGYQTRLVFPALPAGADEFTLVIERLESMPAGAAPEDWQIPLVFETAPPDFEMLPVYELTTPTETLGGQDTALSPTDSAGEAAPFGIQLTLDRVVETEDGFQLQGHTSWDGQNYSLVSFDPWLAGTVTLSDAQGNDIPFEETQPDYSLGPVSPTSSMWALKTNSKSYPGPWTLVVSSMQVNQAVSDPSAAFSIDFGADPQSGQTWQLDQRVQAAGLTLHAISASLREHDLYSNAVLLDILMENDPAVMGIGLEDALNQPQEDQTAAAGGGPGSGRPQDLQAGQQVTSIAYFEMPSGLHSLTVTAISYLVKAEWRASWTPPEVSSEPAPAGTPAAAVSPDTVCLTDEIWQQLSSQPGTLPEGLGGRLLVETTGYLMPQLSLVNLDGSNRQELLLGGWGSISPDGSTVAYIESDGPSLMLLDTATMESRQVPGSVTEDYHAEWSPDGQWLAFVRSNDGIYVSHPDGSGMRQVADASEVRFLVGWLPDNRRLVMTSLGIEGSQTQVLDVETGLTEDMFVIENAKGGFVQLSPDGTRVAFNEQLFGVPAYGVYIANLDGSGKRLVSSLSSGANPGGWSPDGEWLALSVSVQETAGTVKKSVIVQPDTCQVVLLPDVGQIIAWSATP